MMSRLASAFIRYRELIGKLLLYVGLFFIGIRSLGPDSEYIFFVNIGCTILLCTPFYLVTVRGWSAMKSIPIAIATAILLISGNHLHKTTTIISNFQNLYDIHILLIPALAVSICCAYSFLLSLVASIAKRAHDNKRNPDMLTLDDPSISQRLVFESSEHTVSTYKPDSTAPHASTIDSEAVRSSSQITYAKEKSSSQWISRVVQFAIILAAIGLTAYIVFKVLDGYQLIDIDVISTLIWIISMAVVILIVLLSLGAVVIVCCELLRFITRKLLSPSGTSDKQEEKNGMRQYLTSSPIRMYYLSAGIVAFMWWVITNTTNFNLDDLYDITLNNDYLALPILILIYSLVFLVFVQIIKTIITYTLDENRNIGFRNDVREIGSQAVSFVTGSIKNVFSFISLLPDFILQWQFLLMDEGNNEDES